MKDIDAWRLHQPNKQPSRHSDELSELKEPDRLDLPDYFVNLGTGEDLKIKGLATLIKDIVGFQGEILHDLTRPDGTPKKLLDVSKIKALGWRPQIGLDDGIKMTYTWYLKG
jgi:nucleoside-diphosphate-sugar epimerase